MLRFLFSNETDVVISKNVFGKLIAVFEKNLKSKIDEVLRLRKGEVSLNLINDRKIKFLNSKYRGKNKPTDVLSFAYTEGKKTVIPKGGFMQIGDIFISVDTARRQAMEHGHNVKKELCVLFIHGLLHLFGFDHGSDKEESEMGKWAGKVLKHAV